uniref:Transmembrane protein 138 n=1 Tax=Elaeophora elaphi TaxID=1147741 RepID=A0A0R3RTB9_9BILA
LQDALIVLSIIIILIAFSSTFVFQAGLIVLLLSKFGSTIILSLIYLALSILLHCYDTQQYYTISHIKEPYYCYQIRNIIMTQNGFVNKYVGKISSVELYVSKRIHIIQM